MTDRLRDLDDLHPIKREAALQLRTEADVFEFHAAIDEGRGVFTSLLATQGLTEPAMVRALLHVFSARAEPLAEGPRDDNAFMVAVVSGFLLALRLKAKGLV